MRWCVALALGALIGCAGEPETPKKQAPLVEARPGARLKLDREGPAAPFGARVAPARVQPERVEVTYMEQAQSVMRRAELEPFEAALSGASQGMLPPQDASVPLMWRDDPGYRVLAPGGAQRARLVGVGALVEGRGVDKVYHVLERPAGLSEGVSLAVLAGAERQPSMRPAALLNAAADLDATQRAAAEALRAAELSVAADGAQIEAARVRLGAGWHALALVQAVSGADETEAAVALIALDASLQQRRALLGPTLMRGWERWSLLAITDADGDGFEEALLQRGGASGARSQLILVHTRLKPAPDAAPSPYNLCPDLEAGPQHIFFCLDLGAPPAPERAAPSTGAAR